MVSGMTGGGSPIERLLVEVGVDSTKLVSGVDKAVDKSTRSINEFGAKTTSTLGKVGNAFAGMAKIAGGIIMAKGIMQLPGLISGAADAASDLEESLNKATVVFGEASDQIVEWSENAARSLGMSKQQALEAAGTFGNLFTSMGIARTEAAGLSEDVILLAADLASFNNIDPTEALDKLRAGLVGEAEPLRRLGINLTEAGVQARAFEMGLADASGELSVAAKVQARYALIVEQTSNAQGDFERTSEGAANKQRILNAEMEDAKAKIGALILPLKAGLIALLADRLIPAVTVLAETWFPRFQKVLGPTMGLLIEVGAGAATLATAFLDAKAPILAVSILLGVALVASQAAVIAGTISMIFHFGVLNVAAATLAGTLGPLVLVAAAVAAVAALIFLNRQTRNAAEEQRKATQAAKDWATALSQSLQAEAQREGLDVIQHSLAGLGERYEIVTGLAKAWGAAALAAGEKALATRGPDLADAMRDYAMAKAGAEGYEKQVAAIQEQILALNPTMAQLNAALRDGLDPLALGSELWSEYLAWVTSGEKEVADTAEAVTAMTEEIRDQADAILAVTDQLKEYDSQLAKVAGTLTIEEAQLNAVSKSLAAQIKERELLILQDVPMTTAQMAELEGWKEQKVEIDAKTDLMRADKDALVAYIQASEAGRPTLTQQTADIKAVGAAVVDTTAKLGIGTEGQVIFTGAVDGTTEALRRMIDAALAAGEVVAAQALAFGYKNVITYPTAPIYGPPIPSYQHGGIVPGAMGVPVPAIVHGGEEILTPEQRAAPVFNFNMPLSMMGYDLAAMRRLVHAEIDNAFNDAERRAYLAGAPLSSYVG